MVCIITTVVGQEKMLKYTGCPLQLTLIIFSPGPTYNLYSQDPQKVLEILYKTSQRRLLYHIHHHLFSTNFNTYSSASSSPLHHASDYFLPRTGHSPGKRPILGSPCRAACTPCKISPSLSISRLLVRDIPQILKRHPPHRVTM